MSRITWHTSHLILKDLLYIEGHCVGHDLSILPNVMYHDTSYRHHLWGDSEGCLDGVQLSRLDDNNRLLCRVGGFNEAKLGGTRIAYIFFLFFFSGGVIFLIRLIGWLGIDEN